MKRTSSQAGRKAKNHGRARLDALIEEATVDCWGQEEQRTGLLTMIEDQVVCPFRAKVIGEEVTVLEFELIEWTSTPWSGSSRCRRGSSGSRPFKPGRA
jgi:hypothetical protein